MGSEKLSNSLLDDVDEWITINAAILYVKLAYGLVLDAHTIWMLGGKFGFIKEFAGDHLFNAKLLDSTVSRCYFPVIPKGFVTMDVLTMKFPYLPRTIFTKWLGEKKLNTRKIEIGTEEILFIEEKCVHRLHKERRQNVRLKDYAGRDTRFNRNKRGRGKKGNAPKDATTKRKTKTKSKRYKGLLEWYDRGGGEFPLDT